MEGRRKKEEGGRRKEEGNIGLKEEGFFVSLLFRDDIAIIREESGIKRRENPVI